MPLSASTSLGHYEVLSQLGAGGMGEVYLAQDTHLNRKVALKVLPAAVINDRKRLRRFEQEAQAASALNHPNIITIHEIGAEGDTYFIATEYIEGETLRRRLQTTRLEIKEKLSIATQITTALDAAHRSGIVHRDIKPENIMVREDGLVKVLDFGLAKLAEKKTEDVDSQAATRAQVKTEAGMILGTIAYMSPEQARGLEVDARTDIFSLGVVLYEMLAGRLPFAGGTTSDVIAAILKTEPAPLSKINQEIPAELERIVTKTLAKDSEERYQTAKDLLVDLRRLIKQIEFQTEIERTASPRESQNENATQILTARPTSSVAYVAGEIRKHRLVFAIAQSVLLLAAIGLSYWYFAGRSPNSARIESIAVLPFVNASGNADVEYLSDGMTESLITSLSQLPNLNVKASGSVFRYKGKEVEPRKVGAELSVQAVLFGRVVQRGNDLMLYIELVDTNTENTLWKADYNRPMMNLVALQSEIARDVSSKLLVKLSGADEQKLAKNYTENAQAYQLYLKGRFYWNKRTPQDVSTSIGYFQQAIALDPNYALAYTGLADAFAVLPNYGGILPRETKPKARESALKALSLDEGLAEAHTALGLILHEYDYDFAGAEREYKRAIELNPNYATAHQFYGEWLTHRGRHEEAIAKLRRALEIDPLSLTINRLYGESMIFARRYDQAVAQLKKTVELDVNFATAHVSLSTVYQLKDNYAESIDELAKFQELIGEQRNAALIRESFAQGGWEGFLRAMTGTRRPVNFPSYIVATFNAERGEKDKALADLNKSYENREYFMVLLKVDPRFDDLRDDPRFQDLLRRVGLTP